MAIAFGANQLMKLVVRRPRPDLPDLPPVVSTMSNRSYPSAHATTSAAGARALAPCSRPRPVRVATCMALSRPYLGVHYPSDILAGVVLGTALEELSREVGIVGLPNAGKSSLFNALTRAGAEAANYPFTTVEPNVAVVPVPDERLDRVVETIGATPTVYETIEFHDIAGLVAGAHKGEGLGNRFLANIRETDAIVHVVRAHDDAQVVHPEGRVDPAADVETIETELLYADLEQAERRLEKVSREAKSHERALVAEEAWLREGDRRRCAPGRPAGSRRRRRTMRRERSWRPLTAKPVLIVANVPEDDAETVPHAAVRPRRSQRARLPSP